MATFFSGEDLLMDTNVEPLLQQPHSVQLISQDIGVLLFQDGHYHVIGEVLKIQIYGKG